MLDCLSFGLGENWLSEMRIACKAMFVGEFRICKIRWATLLGLYFLKVIACMYAYVLTSFVDFTFCMNSFDLLMFFGCKKL